MPAKKEDRGRAIKYMGSSDVRVLEPGEDLLGNHDPLSQRVQWDRAGSHIVHTADYPDVPESFWDTLCGFSDFQDVTSAYKSSRKSVPQNEYERIYRPDLARQGHVTTVNDLGVTAAASQQEAAEEG